MVLTKCTDPRRCNIHLYCYGLHTCPLFLIKAYFLAYKTILLAISFNKFVQPIDITGYKKLIGLSLTGTVVPVNEIRTYSPLWLGISKSTNQISMRFLIFPKYFFSSACILFSQKCWILKLEEKM